MRFKITKSVPVPTRPPTKPSLSAQLPLLEMKPGDSILVPGSFARWTQVRASVNFFAKVRRNRKEKGFEELRFVCKPVGDGARVWRES